MYIFSIILRHHSAQQQLCAGRPGWLAVLVLIFFTKKTLQHIKHLKREWATWGSVRRALNARNGP